MSEEPKPLSSEQAEVFEQPTDVTGLSDDDLLSAITAPAVEEETEEPVAEEPEVAPEADDPAVAEPEEEPETQEATEEQDTTEEPPPAKDPMEEFSLRLQEMEAGNKLLEQRLGRSTGNEGFLKGKLNELQAENARLRAGQQPSQSAADPYGVDTHGDAVAPPPPAEAAPDPRLQYITEEAIRSGGEAFVQDITGGKDLSELPEVERKALADAANKMQTDPDHQREIREIYATGDPKYAKKATRDLLTTTYWSLRRSQIREQIAQYRAVESDNLKKRKLAATVTQSTTARKPIRRVPSDPAKMTDKAIGSYRKLTLHWLALLLE